MARYVARDADLCAHIRRQIKRGLLPVGLPVRTGTDAVRPRCDACGEYLISGQSAYAVSGSDSVILSLHPECCFLWQTECLAPLPQEDHSSDRPTVGPLDSYSDCEPRKMLFLETQLYVAGLYLELAETIGVSASTHVRNLAHASTALTAIRAKVRSLAPSATRDKLTQRAQELEKRATGP